MTAQTSQKKTRVLYVEDDRVSAQLVQLWLSNEGYDIDLAGDGQEGYNKIIATNYDLILVDSHLPVLDGVELIQRLKKIDRLPPAIMVSAANNLKIAVEAMKSGAVDYIVKTVHGDYLNLLQTTVENHLAHIRVVEEKRLAEKRSNMLSLAIEATYDCIMIIDRKGHIEYINKAFCRYLNQQSEDMIGKAVSDFFQSYGEGSFYPCLQKAIISEKFWKGVIRDQSHSGRVLNALMSVAPIIEDDASINLFVVTQQDMTMQKKVEERLQSVQRLESLGTLIGGIAHEFNNLLAGVTGNLFLARIEVEDRPETAVKLKQAEELSFQASEMISLLLTFARKGLLNRRVIHLNKFLEELLRLVRASLSDHVELHLDLFKKDINIFGDSEQLQQLFFNLLANASDALVGTHSPVILFTAKIKRVSKVFLKAHPELKVNRVVCLTMADNGCGMDADHIANIFEPFFTTKDIGQGSGLGLAVVHGAVLSHDGTIEVESRVGKGTIFHVYLPIHEAEEETKVVDILPPAETRQGILLADDDESVRIITSKILEKLGYDVFLASNGIEAIEIFKANEAKIGLLMLDIVMSQLGGVETLAIIRQHSLKVPVIFITAHDRYHTLQKDLSIPFSKVLKKPLAIDGLQIAIQDSLHV
ncbi:MAG: response regulator [Mariprofundaceae bacterium]|nr:response regulator [Mariprofundaceae bacterium]